MTEHSWGRWTAADLELAAAMAGAGATSRQIGARLGRTGRAVRARLNLAGVRLCPPATGRGGGVPKCKGERPHGNRGKTLPESVSARMTDAELDELIALRRPTMPEDKEAEVPPAPYTIPVVRCGKRHNGLYI